MLGRRVVVGGLWGRDVFGGFLLVGWWVFRVGMVWILLLWVLVWGMGIGFLFGCFVCLLLVLPLLHSVPSVDVHNDAEMPLVM